MEKQFPVDFKFIILFRSDRRMIRMQCDLLPTEMWRTNPEGFDHSDVGPVGPFTQRLGPVEDNAVIILCRECPVPLRMIITSFLRPMMG